MTEKYVANEGTIQKPTRTTKWRGDRQSAWKRIQSNDSKNDLSSGEKNRGTDQEIKRTV